ncbi:unnamed protein product [Polarella glacialis]|uniref:Hexosyltransferase n=1 Tax=Polarella glacialis TaxID=89957 RepID=A0A813F9G7_POLGL|nr:unnamed protein product [Polarella glacialis]
MMSDSRGCSIWMSQGAVNSAAHQSHGDESKSFLLLELQRQMQRSTATWRSSLVSMATFTAHCQPSLPLWHGTWSTGLTLVFFLKTDPDSYVFFERFLPWIDERHLWWDQKHNGPTIYAGAFERGTKAVLTPGSRWRDELYPKATGLMVYPYHAKGAGVLLSHNLVHSIGYMFNFEATRPHDFGGSDDVSVGLWLAGIKHERFDMPVGFMSAVGCRENSVIDHYVSGEEMLEGWQSLESKGDACHHHPLQ